MDGYMGEVKMFGGNFPPKNWLFCEGQLLAVREYPSLYAIMGTTYGGDGRTTFALPDLRGRIPIGNGAGAGLPNRVPGTMGGVERVALSTADMAAHTHGVSGVVGTVKCNGTAGEQTDPTGRKLSRSSANRFNEAVADQSMADGNVKITGTVDTTGAGVAHENMQPWLCTRYIICVVGQSPQRGED